MAQTQTPSAWPIYEAWIKHTMHLTLAGGSLWRKQMSICGHKRAPVEHVILFFSKGTPTGMPEAWPRDAASRSLFSGNHGYMCNLRRSLPRELYAASSRGRYGNAMLTPPCWGKECPKAEFLSHRLEEHHPCPAELGSKTPLQASSKLAIID